MPRSFALASLVLLVGCGLDPLPATETNSGAGDPCVALSSDWTSAGNGFCNRRSADHESKISVTSAPSLSVKWTYDAAGDVSATPAVIDGSLYVPDWGGMLDKLDAATGKVVWSKSVGALASFTDDQGKVRTGLFSRTTPVVAGQLVIVGTQRSVPEILLDRRPNAFVVAVDKDTGETKWKTPLHDGHPAAVITGSPMLDGDFVYVPVSSLEEAFPAYVGNYDCCSFRGSVAKLRVSDGSIVWQTYTIDDAVFYKTDAQGKKVRSGYAGGAVWSSTPAIDHARNQLYITTGNNYSVPAGVTSHEDGDSADSVMALDLDTGAVKWSHALGHQPDVWTFSDEQGPDADFGCGANLFTVNGKDLVGAGQKSGVYYALDPDTGDVVWVTTVGPGGHLGGLHWGTAMDGARIYAGVNDENATLYPVQGAGKHAGETTKVGSWAALDPSTGGVLWQTPNPKGGMGEMGSDVNGPVTVANGVVFVGSMDLMGTMFALDAATGDVLWSFESGGTVYGGAAIVDGVVYWGSGYPKGRLGFGTTSKKLYAFSVP